MASQGVHVSQHHEGSSWKYTAGSWVAFTASYVIFDVLLPDLPPLWAALMVAALFGVFAVALPLVLVARRRNMSSGELST